MLSWQQPYLIGLSASSLRKQHETLALLCLFTKQRPTCVAPLLFASHSRDSAAVSRYPFRISTICTACSAGSATTTPFRNSSPEKEPMASPVMTERTLNRPSG
jgi:hypothetical protein